jgi:hypothetical protein
MADGRRAPPERPATSASSGPIAPRRGRATARCSTPSAPRRRRTSCPGRHALAAARVAPRVAPPRAACAASGARRQGSSRPGAAVEVHAMDSAPSAGGRAHSCCCCTGNARQLERLAGTCDTDLLRLPRHTPPGLLGLRQQPHSSAAARRGLVCRCDGLAASHPAPPGDSRTNPCRWQGDRVVAPSSRRATCWLTTTGATSASTGRAAAPMSDAVAAGFHETSSARCRWASCLSTVGAPSAVPASGHADSRVAAACVRGPPRVSYCAAEDQARRWSVGSAVRGVPRRRRRAALS